MSSAPAASVIITTRNRKNELRKAIESCLQQTVPVEIVIADDASSDGTSEMIRQEFPQAVLFGSDDQRGLIVRRNEAIRRSAAPIVFSLDDDAFFSSPHVVEQILSQFNHPRIGAVNIPMVDVRDGGRLFWMPPDREQVWLHHAFCGCCHAMRRDVFDKIDGYCGPFFHWGEERDFALRMLNLGFVSRRGWADPVHHVRSEVREVGKTRLYLYRNDILFMWFNMPLVYVPAYLVTAIARTCVGRPPKPGKLWPRLVSLAKGFQDAVVYRSRRRPVARATVRAEYFIHKHQPVLLSEVEPLLPRLAT